MTFLAESRAAKLCGIRRILAALPDYTGATFSNIQKLQEERWFSLGDTINYIMIDWTPMIGFLREKREMEAPAALNHIDIARLNKIMVIFTR
jgi:hypothetical protein